MADDENDDERIPRLLTLKQVLRLVPLSRSTLLEMEAQGRFPRGIMLAGNRKAYVEKRIVEWLNTRPMSRGGKGVA
jgi:predicted DNA-binding transcriptional regulator AlpA